MSLQRAQESRFGDKRERNDLTTQIDVILPKSEQAVASIGFGIAPAAEAKCPGIEHPKSQRRDASLHSSVKTLIGCAI